MAASINDLITRVTDSTTGRPVISTLASPGKALGAPSINISDATNWTTISVIFFSIYTTTTVSTQTVKDPTSQTDWMGTLSGTTITNLTITGGTDRAYTTGAIVEQTPTEMYAKRFYDWATSFSDTLGNLKTSAVQAALNQSGSAPADWTTLATTPSVTSSNGQKEYVLTYSGVDYTDRLQKGTKLRIPRSVTPPTQAMSFTAASSQYATKASPTGITFTGNFSCEAWVYLNSYTGSSQFIIDRFNNAAATGGWCMLINSNGQLQLTYGTTNVFTVNATYQSIPLKQWVHVAGTATTATKSIITYINGVSVSSYSLAGSATAVAQDSVDLRIGAAAATSTSTYFDGYISEARVWSQVQTQTQIQNNMSISLTGSESGLVALFQGNGNFNDKTSNANNLTATNGAIATQASNPYNAVEYGIITNVTTATGNTLATVFTGNASSIPNATLGTTGYSSARAPFGFPVEKNRWRISSFYRAQDSGTITLNTWAATHATLTTSTGEWTLGYQGTFNITASTNATISGLFTFQNFTPVNSVFNYDSVTRHYSESANNTVRSSYMSVPRPWSAATTYTLYANADAGSGTVSWQTRGDQGVIELFAESVYI